MLPSFEKKTAWPVVGPAPWKSAVLDPVKTTLTFKPYALPTPFSLADHENSIKLPSGMFFLIVIERVLPLPSQSLSPRSMRFFLYFVEFALDIRKCGHALTATAQRFSLWLFTGVKLVLDMCQRMQKTHLPSLIFTVRMPN